MDTYFKCPHCKQELVVDSSGAGETVPCPTCNRAILIPFDGADPEKALAGKSIDIQTEIIPRQEPEPTPKDKVCQSAKVLVEEHWRQFLTLAHIDMRQAMARLRSFDASIKEMTAHMPEPDATFFRQAIETERQKLADEYDRNPDAIKSRLGLTTPLPDFMPSRNR